MGVALNCTTHSSPLKNKINSFLTLSVFSCFVLGSHSAELRDHQYQGLNQGQWCTKYVLYFPLVLSFWSLQPENWRLRDTQEDRVEMTLPGNSLSCPKSLSLVSPGLIRVSRQSEKKKTRVSLGYLMAHDTSCLLIWSFWSGWERQYRVKALYLHTTDPNSIPHTI